MHVGPYSHLSLDNKEIPMYLVAIAWFYVTLMMALAEATHPQGTVLGAFFTLLLYGVGPLSIVLYLMGTPLRLRARKASEASESAAEVQGREATAPTPQPPQTQG